MRKKGGRVFPLVLGLMAFMLVMGQMGCKSSSTPTTPTTPIVVNSSASSALGQPGMSVQFTCTASGGNGKFTFSWNFGDGGTSTEQNPVHVYSKIGNFTAKVIVNSGSDSNSSSLTIVIFVEQNVFVGPGGGFGEVQFATALSGTIRISLKALIPIMIPYGFLEGTGYSGYFPPQETSNNGVNIGNVNLNAGTFSLTVFDGNNGGGGVTVRIEAI